MQTKLFPEMPDRYPPRGKEWVHYDTPIRELPFVALDCETTGYAPPKARITEIALVPMGGKRGEAFSTLVNPEVPIPAATVNINGIDDALVKDQPVMAQVFPTIADMLEGGIFVAHNVPFDYAFLDQAFRDHADKPLQMPWFCTLKLSRKLLSLPSNALGKVAAHLCIDLKNAHRALADTIAVKGLLEHFFTLLEEKGLKTGGDLIQAKYLRFDRPF